MNYNIGLLKSELMDLQKDITLKDILMVKIMQWNFGIHLKKIDTLPFYQM